MSNTARRIQPLVDPYIDGELPPEKAVEVEQAMLDSGEVAEQVRLSQALQRSTARVVKEHVPSDDFRARLQARLQAERQREEELDAAPVGARALSWRFIVPMAAAAAATLVWAAQVNDENQADRADADDVLASNASGRTAKAATSTNAATMVEQLMDELVSHHASPSEPEVTEPVLVQHFEPRVGVPVRAPKLQDYGARFVGGSVVPVRNSRAASFRYRLDKHRITVYVYDSKRVPVRAHLEPKVVRDVPVYLGERRGYSIAAVEKRGVGYAVATDLEPPETAELVVASMH